MHIDPAIQKRVSYWLNGPFDSDTKKEVHLLQNNPQALIDAFFCNLSFGTGGLRGIMGPGTNRLNIYTIRLATQGLANYLKQQQPSPLSVVIGFDSRNHSIDFAQEAARVLAGNGIRVFLLSELRPTPYVSFVCRLKKASAAIMITASHNPKEYNGFKVYWSDGAQIVSPHEEGIEKQAAKLHDLATIPLVDLTHPLIEHTPVSPLDVAYLKAIAPLQHFKKETLKHGSSLHIVYTSLHGTGVTLIPQALKSWGFFSLHFVDKQMIPDGNFPTVPLPNPEQPDALKMGIETLQNTKADLLLASDPDADRLGVVVSHQGKPILLSGNELAAICADYLGKVLTQTHTLPDRAAFVTTIVTTELLKKISAAYSITLIEVLTGFKYIGEKIHLWETTPNGYTFLFGAEESYGYLLGTHARDKDAAVTSCLVAEIALHAKLQGLTLVDLLHQIYQHHGIYREKQASVLFKPGKKGMDRMATIMATLRAHPPLILGGFRVLYIEDYEKQQRLYFNPEHTEPLSLPKSDALLFRLEDQSRLVIRPSGTEPKIKIYGSTCSEKFETIPQGIKAADAKLATLLALFEGRLL